jgi:hypothetical protein
MSPCLTLFFRLFSIKFEHLCTVQIKLQTTALQCTYMYVFKPLHPGGIRTNDPTFSEAGATTPRHAARPCARFLCLAGLDPLGGHFARDAAVLSSSAVSQTFR